MNNIAESELKNLINQFQENYPKVSYQFENEYDFPDLDPIRYEICICLIVGLGQAAITLTNHLFESSFKRILAHDDFYIDRLKNKGLDYLEALPSYFKKYDNCSLYQNINASFSKELINEDEMNLLLDVKNDYRNAYSHANKLWTFKDEKFTITSLETDQSGNIQSTDHEMEINSMPLFQGFLQAVKSKNESLGYFIFIDSIVRKMLRKRP